MKSVRNNGTITIHFLSSIYKAMVALVVFLLPFSGYSQNIPPAPDPPRLVNDFAGVMSNEQVSALERKLVNYNDTTSTQIAVVTVETLGGADVGEFAAELGEKWGVGTKKNHNGIVILMAKQEHKVTIRTGYGVEEKLGSIITDRIIQNKLVPYFKAGQFYEGFDAATDEMIQRLSGTYTEHVAERHHGAGIPIWVIIIFIFIIFILIPLLFRGGRGGGGTYTGGGYYGGGGFFGGFSGGGGFSSGGGGGGFGGFGGGGFSGGGSSGSW